MQLVCGELSSLTELLLTNYRPYREMFSPTCSYRLLVRSVAELLIRSSVRGARVSLGARERLFEIEKYGCKSRTARATDPVVRARIHFPFPTLCILGIIACVRATRCYKSVPLVLLSDILLLSRGEYRIDVNALRARANHSIRSTATGKFSRVSPLEVPVSPSEIHAVQRVDLNYNSLLQNSRRCDSCVMRRRVQKSPASALREIRNAVHRG